jgi:hypothetical protein
MYRTQPTSERERMRTAAKRTTEGLLAYYIQVK